MRVLWIVNTIFPRASEFLKLSPPASGGWMYSLADTLASLKGISLGVVSLYESEEINSASIEGIQYYFLPRPKKYFRFRSSEWKAIIDDFKPDFVHIHGTEFSYGLSMIREFPDLKYVVSVQGLVSACYRYYFAGISVWDIFKNISARDIVRRDTLFHSRRDFYKRGLFEAEYFRKANFVLGRTEWDRAHVKILNPKVDYRFCNESLREEFYDGMTWDQSKCRPYSIFLSQAAYPLKGLHQVLKAVYILRNEYPDILIEIAGYDITDLSTFKKRIAITGYGKFINRLIAKLGLRDCVKFIGMSDADSMKRAYLRANLFICPSSIENSPNSLGEAQILGVPCVASYVGGIPSIVDDKKTALLYRFEDVEMLAACIKKIFDDKNLSMELSKNGQLEAKLRHDRKINLDALLNIYNQLV